MPLGIMNESTVAIAMMPSSLVFTHNLLVLFIPV